MNAQDESRSGYTPATDINTAISMSDEDILARADEIARRRMATGCQITSSTGAYHAIKQLMQQYDEEHFCILWLDCQHRIISFEDVFTGTIEHCSIHPRILVKRALEVNAAACILAHNHPSGTLEPSNQDIALSQRLDNLFSQLDISVLDHIIVGRGDYVTFKW